ncbi:MAG TPA: sigma-70 family RNA polymerase sigma factor [Acidobacteriota bacterium]|nr:sigma-70 family RNA polymerase sigma factor [Acidobacteriota bacterium]
MKSSASHKITRLLDLINQGDSEASSDLFSVVYLELRKIARNRMARESPGHTLQPTALVHEAYIRLMADEGSRFQNRAHFFSAAAEAMRRILIEHARKKNRNKRQGNMQRIDLDETLAVQEPKADELLELDEALSRLEQHDKQMSDVLKLRFFVGLTVQETADILNAAPRTIDRQWAAARAWLYREMQKNKKP